MSTAPSGFTQLKDNWTPQDVVGANEFSKIGRSVNAIELGERTLDQDLASPANTGSLGQILSWMAGRIRAITGEANWYDNPFVSILQVWNKFNSKTGHRHRGTSSDAPQLGIDSIEDAAKTTAGGKEPNRLAVTNGNGAVGLAADAQKLGGVAASQYATLARAEEVANTRWREEAGFGVAMGLAVSPGSGLTLSVAAGRCYLDNGTRKVFSTTTSVTLATASTAYARKDVIYIDSAGVIRVQQGTPASSPAEPSIPSTAIKLAVVTVPKNASSITASNISDARQFIVGPANGRLVLPVGTDLWAN